MKLSLTFLCFIGILLFSCTSRNSSPGVAKGKDLIDTSKYYYIININSRKYLDIEGGSNDPGAKVIQFQSNGYDNQRFKFRLLPDGLYNIISKKSGKYLDIPYSSKDDGVGLQQFDANGADNQKFELFPLDDGSFNIISKVSGKCLDITGGTIENCAPVIQWQNNGSINQRFKIEKAL